MRLARQVARDGVRFGEHLREVWRVARELEPAEPEYRYWLHDHRPPANQLIAQTRPAARRADPHPGQRSSCCPAATTTWPTRSTRSSPRRSGAGPPRWWASRPAAPTAGSRALPAPTAADGAGRGGRRGRAPRPRGRARAGRPVSSPTSCSTWSPGRGTTRSWTWSTGTTTSSAAPPAVGDPRFRPVVVAGDAAVGQLPRPVVRRAPRPARRGRPARLELGDVVVVGLPPRVST